MDGGCPYFNGEVNISTEKITYKIKSRLGDGMLSAPYLSTGGSHNQLYIILVIPEQAHKMLIFFHKKFGRYRVV